MVDYKTIVIIMTFLTERSLSLYELMVRTMLSQADVLEEIDNLNELLANHHLPLIIYNHGSYKLDDSLRKNQVLIDILKVEQLYLKQEERLNLIYLYTFCRQDFVSNSHYQDFIKVSKNTTLTDIKLLREKLNNYSIELVYTRSKGYRLVGREEDKHQLAHTMISNLLKSPIGPWALNYCLSVWNFSFSYLELEQRVIHFSKTFQLTPIQDRLKESLYTILFILYRYQRVKDRVIKKEVPAVSEQLMALTEMISHWINMEDDLNQGDKTYFTLILSGSFEGEEQHDIVFFNQLTEAIVTEMENISLLRFSDREKLARNLRRHIIPAYYRLQYGLTSTDDYTLIIKEKYNELFQLVKKALLPLALEVGNIPDSEISYFVIHFGGYLKHEGNEFRTDFYKALILCPNGVSSSLILKENLKVIFPQISFHRIARIDELDSIDSKNYDMIFSTVSVVTTKPNYLVSVVMTDEQVNQLVDLVERDFPNSADDDLEIESVLQIIKTHATVHSEKNLRLALQKWLRQDNIRKDVRPLLHELITETTYQTTAQMLNWKEAIRLVAQPLLKAGQIEATYPEAMIAKVEEFGPFINLGKGVAIPHARPEDGVNKVGMSMLVLENPIYLLDDPKQEIKLLICIAAVDNETHLKALSHLTMILRDNKNVEALLASRSYHDIEAIIKQEV